MNRRIAIATCLALLASPALAVDVSVTAAQVSQALSDQEIQALASYVQGLHDRADDAQAVASAAQP